MSQRQSARRPTRKPLQLECEFMRPASAQCPHLTEPLFSSEYRRTNRTRATKIVRCFPHCCPEHRPRSYCNAPVYVRVGAATPASASSAKIFVYGRFEEHKHTSSSSDDAPVPLELGERVQARDIRQAPPSVSIWVHGELEHDAAPSPDSGGACETVQQIYALRGSADGFGHWEYDWKSGTSQRQRTMLHHFRVYVFAARGSNDNENTEWEVVAMATSPPFTFVVYRKHQHSPAVILAQQESSQAPLNNDNGDQHTAAEGVEAIENELNGGDAEDEDGYAHSDDGDDVDGDEEQDEDNGASEALRDWMWHHQHRGVAKTTTSLAILAVLANEIDHGWLLTHRRSLFARLQASDSSPEHLLLHYVNHCVPQLLAALPPRDPTPRTASSFASPQSKWHETMEIWSELVCFLLDSKQIRPIFTFVAAQVSQPSLTSDSRRDIFLPIIELVAQQVEGFLHSRGRSIDGIVDDIVSMVFSDHHQATQHDIQALLRNTHVLGRTHFEYLFEKLRQLKIHNVQSVLDQSNVESSSELSSKWEGRWICRAVEQAEGKQSQPSAATRRSSWPQPSATQHQSSPRDLSPSAWRIGLIPSLALVELAFGFEMSLDFAEPSSTSSSRLVQILRLRPFARPLTEDHGVFQVDDTFHSVAATDNFVALQLAALLMVQSQWGQVHYRARMVRSDTIDETETLELKFLLHSNGQDDSAAWRCVLCFSVPPPATTATTTPTPSSSGQPPSPLSQRRRLRVHVAIDDGHRQALPSHCETNHESTASDDSSSSNDGQASENDASSGTGEKERDEHESGNDRNNSSEDPERVDGRGTGWHPRIAFQCVYYTVT